MRDSTGVRLPTVGVVGLALPPRPTAPQAARLAIRAGMTASRTQLVRRRYESIRRSSLLRGRNRQIAGVPAHFRHGLIDIVHGIVTQQTRELTRARTQRLR